MDGWMDGSMNGRIGGRMDRWINGRNLERGINGGGGSFPVDE